MNVHERNVQEPEKNEVGNDLHVVGAQDHGTMTLNDVEQSVVLHDDQEQGQELEKE